jgi:mono/diheme cytochrome c family protein
MRHRSYALSLLLSCAPALASAATNSTPAPGQSDQIAHGKYLATIGDCEACHTVTGQPELSGGLYLNTPFGKMSTPNLTPDKETGIGSWTDDQFYRALHAGIRNDGAYLYPGLPYPWYTKVTREDVMAIKAYLFSLPPVHAPRKPNHLVFPFNVRAGIAGWNALYFKEGTYQPDASKSPEWNRGAYIVEGLGHCADCHTPKNVAQAPINSEAFAGGKFDDWYAANITTDKKEGIGTWSQAQIVSYLKEGAAAGKGVAFGPMAQTVHDSLSKLTDADLNAIAVYLKTIPPKATYKMAPLQPGAGKEAGQLVYLNYCSSCHQPNGQGIGNAIPPLAGNGAVASQGPENVLRVVIGGLPAQASYGPMPGFATLLSPQQISDVANYVRTEWGNNAPATATPDMVGPLLPKTQSIMAATHWCGPAGTTALDKAIHDPANGIEADMHNINPDNELKQVNAIVKKVQQVAPQASQADVVNRLTAAYCPMIEENKAIQAKLWAPTLDQFSVLTYTELTKGED